MTRIEKLLEAFKRCTGPFPWRDFTKIVEFLGYETVSLAGHSRGSRRRFANKMTGHIIIADEPHDGQMKPGMVRRLRKDLKEAKVL